MTSLDNFQSIFEDPFSFSVLLNLSTIFLFGCVLQTVLRFRKRSEFPVVGKFSDLYGALREGERKHHDRAFALPTSPPVIILPRKCIKEIQTLPEWKVSAARELFRRAAGHYSKVGTNSLAAIKAVRVDLSRDLASITSILQDECVYAFTQNIGKCEDWTPIPVLEQLTRIVSLLSGRVFVDIPLSRNEAWIQLTADWAMDVMQTMYATARYPAFIRPYITPYLGSTKRLLKHRAQAKKLLEPMLAAQLRATEFQVNSTEQCKISADQQMKDEGQPINEKTLAHWILKHVDERHKTVEGLVRNQLSISFAAVHTSSEHLTQALFDLAVMPEYQALLLEEIGPVFAECGGRLQREDIGKLKKLDSFLKESQRMNPGTLIQMLRLTTAPLTLSTGQIVPAGTPIGIYSKGINESPNLYTSPPPDVFHGFRFYRMRQIQGQENRHQFVNTGPTEGLDFGHGVHACPGRFFANIQIKTILIHLLRNYELKLKDGEERPKNVSNEIWVSPDPKAQVLFKAREQ